MKPVESALTPSNGYINSFTRNTQEGWWEIEVGLPASWVFDENSKIGCETTFDNEIGKLIRVFPKENDIVVDDLIDFIEVIISINEKIAEKEKQFTDKMQEMKSVLEQEAQKFYKELDELKENSFKKKSENTIKKSKPKRKPRTSKKTNIINENIEVIESPEK